MLFSDLTFVSCQSHQLPVQAAGGEEWPTLAQQGYNTELSKLFEFSFAPLPEKVIRSKHI